jgi:hypothetical protein
MKLRFQLLITVVAALLAVMLILSSARGAAIP